MGGGCVEVGVATTGAQGSKRLLEFGMNVGTIWQLGSLYCSGHTYRRQVGLLGDLPLAWLVFRARETSHKTINLGMEVRRGVCGTKFFGKRSLTACG